VAQKLLAALAREINANCTKFAATGLINNDPSNAPPARLILCQQENQAFGSTQRNSINVLKKHAGVSIGKVVRLGKELRRAHKELGNREHSLVCFLNAPEPRTFRDERDSYATIAS